MKLKYYGTAAAEGFPAMFCDCDTCARALASRGRNLRTRSQSCIDDKLLIDFCADTNMHCLRAGLPMRSIRSLLVTHAHEDHFYVGELSRILPRYVIRKDPAPLKIFGGEAVLEKLRTALAPNDCVEPVLVREYETFETDGYTVTPLPALHDPAASPVIYLIEKGGKKLLYAHDTGYFSDKVLDWLQHNAGYIGLVSLDCNYGINDRPPKMHHMCFAQNLRMAAELRVRGVCDEATVFVSNHFTHNCGRTYDEMVRDTAGSGFLISYDGMEVEF